MDHTNQYLLNFKGYYFQRFLAETDILENLADFEIRDDDVFIITYPKSGKFKEWTTCFRPHFGLRIHVCQCPLFQTLAVVHPMIRKFMMPKKNLN